MAKFQYKVAMVLTVEGADHIDAQAKAEKMARELSFDLRYEDAEFIRKNGEIEVNFEQAIPDTKPSKHAEQAAKVAQMIDAAPQNLNALGCMTVEYCDALFTEIHKLPIEISLPTVRKLLADGISIPLASRQWQEFIVKFRHVIVG